MLNVANINPVLSINGGLVWRGVNKMAPVRLAGRLLLSCLFVCMDVCLAS